MTTTHVIRFVLPVLASIAVAAQQQPPPAGNQTPQQPGTIATSVIGEAGTPPRIAIPDFLALSNDRETQDIARSIAEVLWDDLNFEREFYMIPRDTYKSIPVAASIAEPPLDRWRELGADGVVMGSVSKTGLTIRVEMRLYRVASRQQLYAREYSGSAANPRLYAHTIADEIHDSQRQLRGVARTKLTFSSDRNKERVTGTVENRDVKEVYIGDYDGANQRRITVNRQLNITPVWSPDARSIAYTSYRSGFPDIYISMIFQGTMSSPTKAVGPELAAGVLAGRHADRVHVESRRQPRALHLECRRQQHPPADEPSRDRHHADLVAVGYADRVHVGSRRPAVDLGRRRRWARAAPHLVRTTRIGRPGRRRRTTRSPTPRAPGPATTSRS